MNIENLKKIRKWKEKYVATTSEYIDRKMIPDRNRERYIRKKKNVCVEYGKLFSRLEMNRYSLTSNFAKLEKNIVKIIFCTSFLSFFLMHQRLLRILMNSQIWSHLKQTDTHTYIYIYIYICTSKWIHSYVYIRTHPHTHTHTYIYIYIYTSTHSCIYMHHDVMLLAWISLTLSLSLSPFVSIIRHFQQVLYTASCVRTELFEISAFWSSYTCISVWRGPLKNVTYEFVLTTSASVQSLTSHV